MIILRAIFVMLAITFTTIGAYAKEDHLVPVDEEVGVGAAYQKLWSEKLLVTPGDVARFVILPGNTGEEGAVSIYQAIGKAGSLPGDYWLVVTQPSMRLWDCLAIAGGEKPVDPQTIVIDRCDRPFPQSTARLLNKLWLAMLSEVKPEPKQESVLLDSSTGIASAKNAEGRMLIGQLPKEPGKRTFSLFSIANSLIEYCNLNAADRPASARKIERKVLALLRHSASSRTSATTPRR